MNNNGEQGYVNQYFIQDYLIEDIKPNIEGRRDLLKMIEINFTQFIMEININNI